MNLYLVLRIDYTGQDEYRGAVVAAKTKASARRMHPETGAEWNDDGSRGWVSNLDFVTARYLGVARADTEAGVILADYKAG